MKSLPSELVGDLKWKLQLVGVCILFALPFYLVSGETAAVVAGLLVGSTAFVFFYFSKGAVITRDQETPRLSTRSHSLNRNGRRMRRRNRKGPDFSFIENRRMLACTLDLNAGELQISGSDVITVAEIDGAVESIDSSSNSIFFDLEDSERPLVFTSLECESRSEVQNCEESVSFEIHEQNRVVEHQLSPSCK